MRSRLIILMLSLAFPAAIAQLGDDGSDTSTRLKEQADRRAAEQREREYNKIISDFIAYDIGKVRNPQQVREILRRYHKLKTDDSVPALVRGLNYSTNLRASCPITALSDRLRHILRRSKDPEVGLHVMRNLTDRNVGAYTYHVKRVLKEAEQQYIRIKKDEMARAQFERKTGAANQRLTFNPDRTLDNVPARRPTKGSTGNKNVDSALQALSRRGSSSRSTSQLERATSRTSQESPKKRDSKKSPTTDLKSSSITDLLAGLSQPSASLLDELYRRSLGAQKAEVLKKGELIVPAISHKDPSVRQRAIRIAGLVRIEAALPALIERLSDTDKSVRSSAATALTRITRQLFGPSDRASDSERAQAIARWREWYAKNFPTP